MYTYIYILYHIYIYIIYVFHISRPLLNGTWTYIHICTHICKGVAQCSEASHVKIESECVSGCGLAGALPTAPRLASGRTDKLAGGRTAGRVGGGQVG